MNRRRFFLRNARSKLDHEHIGRAGNIQTFYEAPKTSEKDELKWVDYAPPSLPQAKREKHEGAAVQVYKRRDENNVGRDGFKIYKVRLQSPYLRKALRDTLEKYGIVYEGQEIFAESVAPHYGLFYALDRVAELAKTADDEITRSHCGLLCSVIEEIFGDTIDRLEELENQGNKITFELLWTLFPPKSIFAMRNDGVPPLAHQVKSVTQDEWRLKLTYESVLFDGFRYGTYTFEYRVWRFDGAVPTINIPDFPYIDLSRDPALRARLIERGKAALELQEIRYMVYKPETTGSDEHTSPWLKGQNHQRVIIDPHLYRLRRTAFYIRPLPGYNLTDEELLEEMDDRDPVDAEQTRDSGAGREQGQDKGSHGRDTQKKARRFDRFESEGASGEVRRSERRAGGGRGRRDPLRSALRRPNKSEMERNRRVVLESEDNLVIIHYQVVGYSVDKRTWEMFYIEDLEPFQGDRTVFDKVVLEEAKKDILMTLIEGHKELTAKYDDLIAGKGQYLLVILSGPPGTGKTLMAESLAEHLACPLLRADPTSIQPNEFQLINGYDATLTQFLKDATEWGGLVLFDEPDFLFQSQSDKSTDRQDLLAFLRQAEYFKGIIFLTTNLSRGKIDPAVLSRAQIHITFPPLTAPLRARVWKGFIDRLPDDVGTLDDDAVAQLSKWHVNGREIKNILNMSVSWCRRKKCQLSVDYIETLIETICPSARREDDEVKDGDEAGKDGEGSAATKGSSVKDDFLLLDI